MNPNRPVIARMQEAFKQSLSCIVGHDQKPARKHVETHMQHGVVSQHIHAYLEVGKAKYRRVYVEYQGDHDEPVSSYVAFKLAFIPEGKMLGDATWQDHSFHVRGHSPEAAGSILASHAHAWFTKNEAPTQEAVAEKLRLMH